MKDFVRAAKKKKKCSGVVLLIDLEIRPELLEEVSVKVTVTNQAPRRNDFDRIGRIFEREQVHNPLLHSGCCYAKDS